MSQPHAWPTSYPSPKPLLRLWLRLKHDRHHLGVKQELRTDSFQGGRAPFWREKLRLPSRQPHTHGPPGYSGSPFPGTLIRSLPLHQPGAASARWHPCLGRIPRRGGVSTLTLQGFLLPHMACAHTGVGELPWGAVGAADPQGLVGQPETEGRGRRGHLKG